MEFSGKNTGVRSHSLLQEIFSTQGWNFDSPPAAHCKWILYHLSRQASILPLRFCNTFSFMSIPIQCIPWGSLQVMSHSLNGIFPNRADLDPLGSCSQIASTFLCPHLVSACSFFGPLTASGSLEDFPQAAAVPLPACSSPKSGCAGSVPVLQRPWAGVWPVEKHGSSGLLLKCSHVPAFSCRTWLELSSMRLWNSFFFPVLLSSFP